ncbi:MAG: hypothetical protein GX490_04585 [Bacilli bacterium]|nr:hypothetical protein [Bacilli bacterium]
MVLLYKKPKCARGITHFTSKFILAGLTDADIPEGGFLIITSYVIKDYEENLPARKLVLDNLCRVESQVKIHGFDIPGYTQKSDAELLQFYGVDDYFNKKNVLTATTKPNFFNHRIIIDDKDGFVRFVRILYDYEGTEYLEELNLAR